MFKLYLNSKNKIYYEIAHKLLLIIQAAVTYFHVPYSKGVKHKLVILVMMLKYISGHNQ